MYNLPTLLQCSSATSCVPGKLCPLHDIWLVSYFISDNSTETHYTNHSFLSIHILNWGSVLVGTVALYSPCPLNHIIDIELEILHPKFGVYEYYCARPRTFMGSGFKHLYMYSTFIGHLFICTCMCDYNFKPSGSCNAVCWVESHSTKWQNTFFEMTSLGEVCCFTYTVIVESLEENCLMIL